jgi:FkbM family methyltransferase
MRPVAEYTGLRWTGNVNEQFKYLDPLSVMLRLEHRVRDTYSSRGRELRALNTHEAPIKNEISSKIAELACLPNFSMVQIGAHNGSFDDPFSKLLADHPQARAVLVEPQAIPFNELAARYARRSNVTCLQTAVSSISAESMELWHADISGYKEFGSAIAAQTREQVQREIIRNLGRSAAKKSIIQPIKVPVKGIKELLYDLDMQTENIDLFACDTEGHDAVIVNALLDTGTPRTIMYEHLHVDPSDTADTDIRLAELGFSWLKTHKDTFAWQENLVA